MIKPQMYANLHNHTTHSDGVYDIEQIVSIIKSEGYGAAAITDHDTVTGNSEMLAVCKREGLDALFGCEFMANSEKNGLHYHLTAFNFDITGEKMKEYLRRCSLTMTEKTRIIFERGKAHGLLPAELDWEYIVKDNQGITWLCNDHVFRTMKKLGYYEDKDYPSFFEDIFGVHGKGIAPLYEKLSLEKIIPLIKEAGGIVCVAHPHKQLETIPYLIELGIDGMEVWHPDLTPEEIPEALKIARDNNLFISGGPDHSGVSGGQYQFYEDYKRCPWYIPESSTGTTKELFEEIKTRKLLEGRKDLINEYLEYYDKCK